MYVRCSGELEDVFLSDTKSLEDLRLIHAFDGRKETWPYNSYSVTPSPFQTSSFMFLSNFTYTSIQFHAEKCIITNFSCSIGVGVWAGTKLQTFALKQFHSGLYFRYSETQYWLGITYSFTMLIYRN